MQLAHRRGLVPTCPAVHEIIVEGEATIEGLRLVRTFVPIGKQYNRSKEQERDHKPEVPSTPTTTFIRYDRIILAF